MSTVICGNSVLSPSIDLENYVSNEKIPPKKRYIKLVFRLTRIDKLNNLVSNLILDD